MSLILKGIDLPTNGQIELIIRPHGKVLSKTRGISAQAIQIPKDHGRIIDENNWTTHEVLEPMGNGQYEEVEVAYKGDIDNAPTILAEETNEY